MKKILVTGALVVGIFFSGCTASLTQAYSDTVNSINETAREVNAKNEESSLSTMSSRYASNFINDLYEKANVKDDRYLYF